MTTVAGIVSPGLMGRAIGTALVTAGHRVIVTTSGRSERTARLAAESGLEQVADLDGLVTEAGVVLSVVPPGEARSAARAIAEAAGRCGGSPLLVDLNAVSPGTIRLIAETVATAGLELVDGSISGPPPQGDPHTRVYLSGDRAAEVAEVLWCRRSLPASFPVRRGSRQR